MNQFCFKQTVIKDYGSDNTVRRFQSLVVEVRWAVLILVPLVGDFLLCGRVFIFPIVRLCYNHGRIVALFWMH